MIDVNKRSVCTYEVKVGDKSLVGISIDIDELSKLEEGNKLRFLSAICSFEQLATAGNDNILYEQTKKDLRDCGFIKKIAKTYVKNKN